MWTYLGDGFDENEILNKMKACGYSFSTYSRDINTLSIIKKWGSNSLMLSDDNSLYHATKEYMKKTYGEPVPQEVFFSKYYEVKNKLVCEFDYEEKCLKVISSNGTEICIYDGVDGISVSFDKALYKANLSSKYDTPVFNVEKL